MMHPATVSRIAEHCVDARRSTTLEEELTALRRLKVEIDIEIARVESKIYLRDHQDEFLEARRGQSFFQ